mmetsp:Transcript_89791/g.159654  ORF Transcript_89791/g.159654 Transcript_89791/m.159654 type:complete len:2242 (-) Transcript_89791:140-6865(-)|eukprot:CAMPEP_0197628650 /NCGR_PEP_ID=MMETSP1338-20131121/6861_1 /TAXON_ID=43686 ORGANISM="Pelagodinium beii, Strain RCC1491" /NCGR_SAMPLE_ID=MMETSP1338 /ASSEMBLY_ACC=CAM_ASM_000754 /LENGTH=2241 /DNA_ID=CAMNT_0043199639 /DNA_START=159 /DNA_END=6884 /DNA_ORIENTATION=+
MSDAGPPVEDAEEPAEEKKVAKDHPRHYIGWVYEDVFKELYNPTPEPKEEEHAPEEDGAEKEEAQTHQVDEIDLSMEDEEIKRIQSAIVEEKDRLQQIIERLDAQESDARTLDRQDAEYLHARWGLVMKEQVPVPQSKLRHVLLSKDLDPEGLVIPRRMMEDMERYFEIKKGTIPHHDNLLAISKPEEPNYFKETKSLQIRNKVSNKKATLTEDQKALITTEIEERFRRQPRMPVGLNAEEKGKNREIMKRMQMKVNFLKNPRFLADRASKEKGEPCPFWFTPESVVFQNYEVGGLYEIKVEFRNCTGIGRRLRVQPCKSNAFSISKLRYDKEVNSQRPQLVGYDDLAAVVAPGMAAHLTVHFAPSTLNDQQEVLTVCTELGDFELPLLSRRVQPKLEFAEPVNCGCMLAGNTMTEDVKIKNLGGEGSFRLVVTEDTTTDFHYETKANGETTLVCGEFRVTPASFYLEAKSSISIEVFFGASEVGQHRCPLYVECDNGEKIPLTLVAIADAVRLELAKWPTLRTPVVPRPPDPGSSVWNLLPWQLNWLSPGTQVGHQGSQYLEIANGGYLPMKVSWNVARPPRQMLSRLAVGSQNRLTEEMLANIHTWLRVDSKDWGSASCPFNVEPATMTIPPFSQAQFNFTFKAHPPVGTQSTCFAYLVANELPDSREALLTYSKLLDLQGHMQPEEYRKGLPLFGGAVTESFNRALRKDGSRDPLALKSAEAKDCFVSHAITAVCLKGISTKPAVSVLPRLLALAGDVLPFVSHTREIKLRNTGSMPAYFRVRLTSTSHAADANSIDPLWIVSVPEVGPRPAPPESDPNATDPVLEQRRLQAATLAKQWPPLPPEEGAEGASMMQGYGALASCAVEPHEGRIPAGGTVTLRITCRPARECDLDGHMVIDMPVDEHSNAMAMPPIKIGVVAAVRSPRPELRHTPFLDYGVVRAHGRHSLKVRLDNPSDLPMLMRLKQHHEGDAPGLADFPVESHREVVNMFVKAVNGGSKANFAPVHAKETEERIAEPWVHSKSGCLDMSGRRKYGMRTGPAEKAAKTSGVSDEEDFIFKPGFVALWPHQSCEVEVILRTREVGRYSQFIKALSFNSLSAQCLEVLAEVQLPQVRINTQHAHFPVTYLRTASEPYAIEVRNDSDMRASFKWDVPLKMEACLECQIDPPKGIIPPRSKIKSYITAVPTREDDKGDAVLPCNLFIDEILQPLELRVTAIVYGCEVDYAIVPPGELPPEILHIPRQPGEGPCDPRGTYHISTGRAPRSMPIIDFGEMEIQKAKVMQVVLYNRTGIATPFSAKIEKNPAYDPLVKGRKIGDLLDAATRMYALSQKAGNPDDATTEVNEASIDGGDGARRDSAAMMDLDPQTFENSPQPAGAGRDPEGRRESTGTMRPGSGQGKRRASQTGSMKSTLGKSKKMSMKKRRWLLDDKHERQAFRSSIGADFAKQKELKEAGKVALKAGRGFAVRLTPSSDWLQPFSTTVITLTCFSDLPGVMDDELVLTVRETKGHSEGQDFRVPIKLMTFGNPLYLPDQQVGLNIMTTPPRLFCGTTVPAEKLMMRRFKVGNNSSAKVHITWKVYPKRQIENNSEDRQLVKIALCSAKAGAPDPFVDVDDNKSEQASLGIDADVTDAVSVEEEDIDPDEPFDFKIWTQDPPDVEDPFSLPEGGMPVVIEPEEAILPDHGTGTFSVSMICSKATAMAAMNYRYTLVGKARFTKDREQRLAFAEMHPGESFDDRRPQTVYNAVAVNAQVADLPNIKMNKEDLMESDSDLEDERPKLKAAVQEAAQEENKDSLARTTPSRSKGIPQPEPLATEPELDVISTVVIDCVGDCVLPRLTVDKKGNPGVEDYPPQNQKHDQIDESDPNPPVLNAPVFKFTWAASPAEKQRASGATHGGLPGGVQIPGIASCLVRQVTLSNHNASNVTCRFKTVGPFRIRQIQQVGQHPVVLVSDAAGGKKKAKESQNSEAAQQLFVVAKWETISLQVEFMPDWVPSSEWEHLPVKNEHTFKGDLVVEYPREKSPDVVTDKKDDLQRIHLVGTARRPAMRIHVVPMELDRPLRIERAEKPPWGEVIPMVVEFGYTHIDSSVTRSRVILLSNVSNILAKWSLMHVGRKRRQPHIIGCTLPEEEDFRALDDKDAFQFDLSAGDLPGPSKDGLVPDSEERLPHWCAKSAAVPRGLPFADEERYEPQKVKISFKPKKNELYKCRFRVQVEGGLSIDFICRGCGSYDEEDDNVDFEEA